MQQLGLSQPVVLKMQWKHLNLIYSVHENVYKKKVHCVHCQHSFYPQHVHLEETPLVGKMCMIPEYLHENLTNWMEN